MARCSKCPAMPGRTYFEDALANLRARARGQPVAHRQGADRRAAAALDADGAARILLAVLRPAGCRRAGWSSSRRTPQGAGPTWRARAPSSPPATRASPMAPMSGTTPSPCSTAPRASPSSCGGTARRATRSSSTSRRSRSRIQLITEPPMPYEVNRDFIGYGANPPDPHWPGGARLAVNFVMNYEEGSEPSMQDGDGFTETGLTEAHGLRPGQVRPRPRRRGHVRIRQPRRLLAADAAVPGTRPAADRVRLRAGAGAQPRKPPPRSATPASTSAPMAGAGSSISSCPRPRSASTSPAPSPASRRPSASGRTAGTAATGPA